MSQTRDRLSGMVSYDNPAVRLHRLMNGVLNLKGQGTAPMRKFWPGLLGLGGDDDPMELLRRHSVAALWPSQVQQLLVEYLPQEDHEDYAAALRPCVVVLGASLDSRLDGVKRQLSEAIVTKLQYCARDLSRELKQEAIQHEQVQTWLAEVEQLEREITASDLPAQVRDNLLRALLQLRQGLQDYLFAGPDWLRQAAEAATGAVILSLHRHNLEHPEDEITKDSLADRVFQVSTRVALAVALVNGAHQLTSTLGAAIRALPG